MDACVECDKFSRYLCDECGCCRNCCDCADEEEEESAERDPEPD